jgi:hydroxymethylglutaryl-CoA lyase
LPGGYTALLPGDRFQSLQSLVGPGRAAGLPVRAYLSCVLGCPYEGPISRERVAPLAGRLHELGCEEIALGDTIGAGTPLTACRLVEATAHRVIAVHFHDTPAARHWPTSWRASG